MFCFLDGSPSGVILHFYLAMDFPGHHFRKTLCESIKFWAEGNQERERGLGSKTQNIFKLHDSLPQEVSCLAGQS